MRLLCAGSIHEPSRTRDLVISDIEPTFNRDPKRAVLRLPQLWMGVDWSMHVIAYPRTLRKE